MADTVVRGINVLTVYVSDLERAKSFYMDHLGFAESGQVPPGILLEAGSVTLYMEPGRVCRSTESRKETEYSPCFDTGSVKNSYEALTSAGVLIVEDYQEFAPTFAMFKFLDPDGNLIEIAGEP